MSRNRIAVFRSRTRHNFNKTIADRDFQTDSIKLILDAEDLTKSNSTDISSTINSTATLTSMSSNSAAAVPGEQVRRWCRQKLRLNVADDAWGDQHGDRNNIVLNKILP